MSEWLKLCALCCQRVPVTLEPAIMAELAFCKEIYHHALIVYGSFLLKGWTSRSLGDKEG